MTSKVYPKGFNEKLKLANEAINGFIFGDSFYGVVSPGELYTFCKQKNNLKFSEIDAYFFNRWDDLNLKTLCESKKVSYRKSKPKKTASQSASRTVRRMIELAIDAPNGSDLKKIIASANGQTRDVASANINRCIGMENLHYLIDIRFDVEDVPELKRDDLKKFFQTIRINRLTNLNQYINLVRKRISKSISFDDFPEHKGPPKKGWIYLFPSKSTPSIVKCGQSERRSAEKRLDEHVLSKLASEGVWAYIYRSDDIDAHESTLISILHVEGKLVENTKETFKIGRKKTERIWQEFLSRVPT